MKPIIGITSSIEIDNKASAVGTENINVISKADGLPLFLPNLADDQDIQQLAEMIDGLYVTGGYDIDPTLFGEEPHPNLGTVIPSRDIFELELVKKVLKLNKPVLAVCKGCQILNIAAGGDMYQDIYTQINHDLLQHAQKAPKAHGSHYVHVKKGSLLNRITEMEKLKVNSRHHQANRNVSRSFMISGEASDGVIEAIEGKEYLFALGLQWHPENMVEKEDIASVKIYQSFMEACKNRKAKVTT